MADINLSIQVGATASSNIIRGDTIGAINNIRDDNENTNFRVHIFAPPFGSNNYEFNLDVDFGQTATTINKVEVVSSSDSDASGCTQYKIYLYYNSAWNLVYTIQNGAAATWAKRTNSQLGTWNNVTKIRVYGYGTALGDEMFPDTAGLNTYELRAWGVVYQDIGFRVRASGSTLKIGVVALNGHKLRIRKGATTYGIPLLTPGDSSDSGLRIFDGSSVKALPKVD